MTGESRSGGDVGAVIADAETGLTLTIVQGVAIVTYNQPSSPVNTLNSRVAPVFDRLFTRIEQDASIAGAVLVSGKSDPWIAGADIEEPTRIENAAQGEGLSAGGPARPDRLAAPRKTVVCRRSCRELGRRQRGGRPCGCTWAVRC